VGVPFEVPLTRIASLPRTRVVADFHCVAGWTATDLAWAGTRFADFYREVVAPAVAPAHEVSHLVLVGLDGYRCVVGLADVLSDDVLLADELDGEPLDGDHGAPLRFVSPNQYGYVSVKHLCAIELHVEEPKENFGAATALGRRFMVRPLFARHPRSRVWHEERNALLPAWLIRPVYRAITPPIARLSARGRTPRTPPTAGGR
jgi:DMSO/TMAO reductase YedYZ molybdopterin-dependent catalytic subunit